MTPTLPAPRTDASDGLPRPAAAALDAAFEAERLDPAGRSGAHLAGFELRLGPASVVLAGTAAPRPDGPGADWTLADTFAEIRRRGARLTLASRGVRLAHAHRMPDLAAAVRRHEPALAVWLGMGPVAAPFDATDWDDEVRLYAGWLATQAPPTVGRIALRPGHTVVGGRAFREGAAARLALGPAHPGANGLRADLAALFAQLGPNAVAQRAAPARRALAA